MKILIKQDPTAVEPEITIVCKTLTPVLEDVIEQLRLADNIITGVKDDELFFFPLSEILYFETVDRRVFFYTEEGEYEAKTTLSHLEARFSGTPFVRVSKQALANLSKIRSVKREQNSRLCATFLSGDKIIVSRQYLGDIMKKLGVE